ncbi:MAG: phosphoglycerate dehydrogenase [Chloroflexi bacterium]|nr:phosphoglycerate dehydrogenase [Chloroflexota bacterium]
MTIKIAVTARSLCASRGEPWHILEAAGYQSIPIAQDRPLSEVELAEFWKDADGAILGLDAATARAISSATKLRVIARYGIGVDKVDIAAATARGIVVTNAPGASLVAVAELTIAMMLALARRIPQHDRLVRAGSWSRIVGTGLSGKTVGLIGLGRIGRAVAKRAAAFDAKVCYFDPARLPGAEERALGVRFVQLDELFGEADFVSLHAILDDTTRNTVNSRTLALMKPTAFLVNTARGELVDEAALAAALSAGKIAGVALDTRVREPPPSDDPLAVFDNVILTPHIGAATHEATLQVGLIAARSVVAVLGGKRPENVVNPEVYLAQSR